MSEWVEVVSIAASSVGTIAVVLAVVYASRQTTTLREQLELNHRQVAQSLTARRAANDLSLMGHTMALDRLFIDNPGLRPFFYDDVAVPVNEPLRAQVLATAELIVDLADSVSSMIRHDQLSHTDEVAWERAFRMYGLSSAVGAVIDSDLSEGAWRDSTLELLRPGVTRGRAQSLVPQSSPRS